MDPQKRRRLESAGYSVYDTVDDWLKLTDEERKIVEFRIALSRAVREARERVGFTQSELAKKMKTSQPCIARIEAGIPGVSLNLSMKALFASGGGLDEIIRACKGSHKSPQNGKKPSPKKLRSKAQSALPH